MKKEQKSLYRYISLVFIFLTRLVFSGRLSIAEVLRKKYCDQTLKLDSLKRQTLSIRSLF